jgi:hypothetical protein
MTLQMRSAVGQNAFDFDSVWQTIQPGTPRH